MPRRPWEMNKNERMNLPIGKTKDGLNVFHDAKTGLFYFEDSTAPNNKRYIKKSKIIFSTTT